MYCVFVTLKMTIINFLSIGICRPWGGARSSRFSRLHVHWFGDNLWGIVRYLPQLDSDDPFRSGCRKNWWKSQHSAILPSIPSSSFSAKLIKIRGYTSDFLLAMVMRLTRWISAGLPRSGKSQGIAYQVREFLNSTWKSVKSQRILRLSSYLGLERDSSVVKVFSFQKILQRFSFLLSLLLKDLPWMVSENWSLVSEKSGKCQGIFSIPMGANPVLAIVLHLVMKRFVLE